MSGHGQRETDVNRQLLPEALQPAVQLHMEALRDIPADRRRFHIPPGGLEALGFADAILFRGGNWRTTTRVFDTYARTLAVLAFQPGGVNLFGAHWCVDRHPNCPNNGPQPLNLVARCQAALASPEWQKPLDDLEKLLNTPASPPASPPERPRRRRRAVPERLPISLRPVVDVPTGSLL